MEWYVALAITFGVLLVALASGIPVAFGLGVIGLLGSLFFFGLDASKILATTAFRWGTLFTAIAVPLFMFMAEFLLFAGAARDLFTCAQKWLNRIPGSLAVAGIAACAGFAAIVGGSAVCAAAIGRIALPEMLEKGYDTKLATGTICAGGTLGIIIPPSMPMILYGILTEESIGALFMGGVIPGIILTVLFSLYVILRVARNPRLAPIIPGGVSWRERIVSLRLVWPIIFIVLLVLGTVYTGITTITESAALGCLGAIIVAIIYRRGSRAEIRKSLLNSVKTSSFITFIIMGAVTFGYLITRLGIPLAMTEWVTSLNVSPLTVIIMINLLFLFLGCFIDPASIIVLTVPILLPIIVRLGFDPVWFGVMMTVNMEMANITPPVGLNLFVLKGISPPQVTLMDIIIGSQPFVILLAIVIALMIAFPQLVMFLPQHMMG